MCAHNSANAPEFFLHHAFIDKIWADWQEKSTSHMFVYFDNLRDDLRMQEAEFHPRDYIDTLYMPHPDIDSSEDEGRVCVVYQDPVHPLYNEIMNRLERLTTREIRRVPRLPFRPATARQLRRLGVHRKERRAARKLLKKELQPKIRLRPEQLRNIYDRMLGFHLKDLPFKFSAKDSTVKNSLMYDRWLAKAANNATGFKTEGVNTFRFRNISSTFV